MNMHEIARDYMRRAEVRLKSAFLTLNSGSYPDVVRFSQECVELSLKAALKLKGIEYPKEHDVGRMLRNVSYLFPEWFRSDLEKIEAISRDLASKRSASLYGLETANKPASTLFSKHDAESSYKDARFVFKNVKKLFSRKK